jgi:hypothetical protein
VKKPVNLSCTVRKDSNQGKRKIPYQNQNRVADVEIPDRIHFWTVINEKEKEKEREREIPSENKVPRAKQKKKNPQYIYTYI